MLALLLFRILASAAAQLPWMLSLASRVAARLLNMPEPMLHHIGAFVLAQVQAVENGVIAYGSEAIRKFKDRLASSRGQQGAA